MATEKTPFEQSRRAQAAFATKPTDFTKSLRTSVLWQIVRFVVINLKMIKVIRKSHS
jgi:hypothetical protein